MLRNKVGLAVALMGLASLAAAALSAQYASTSITNDFAGNNISTTGTVLVGGASTDDGQEQVNFPGGFTFTFYGNNYTSITVNSNGWISMGAPQTLTTVQMRTAPASTPLAAVPNDFIAGWYDDLNPADALSDNVYVELLTGPSRFVVMFNNIDHFGAGTAGGASFSIVLFATGVIEIHYGAGQTIATGVGAVAVENLAGNDGTAGPGGIAVFPTSTSAYRFTPPAPPGDPEINLQQPTPTNRLSGSTYSVGGRPTGSASAFTFTVQNLGATQNLNVTSVSAAPSGVGNCTTNTTALSPASPIAAAGSATFNLQITPTAGGAFECTVTVASNDADEGTYTVIVQGTGEATVASFPYTQTFETFPPDIANPVPLPAASGWQNLTDDGGTQDWAIDAGGTPSANTGPAVDHTLGTAAGIYLFVEDSNTAQGNVNMVTPWFNLTGLTAPVARFWIHANDANGGANDNTLHIDVINATTGSTTQDVITPIGHVADATLTVWTLVTIDMTSFVGNVVRIRFRLQDNGGSFTHDVAVDDFDLREFPEIDVQRPAGTSIASGGTDNIGGVLTTGANFTYTIENTGAATLNLTGVAPDYVVVAAGTGAPTVTVTTQPSATVTASGTTTFVINVVPAAGAFDFTVTIANDDANENPYLFTVSGNGVSNVPPTLALATTTTFVAGTDFDLTLAPGATLVTADLTFDDVTPDDVVVTITAPGTAPTGITGPTGGTTPAASLPGTLSWTGTADASNAPGTYTWQVSLNDGVTTVLYDVNIIITDVAPTHVGATGQPGTADGSAANPYEAVYTQGMSTPAVDLATVTDANTGQTLSITGTALASGPGTGSGFTFTLASGTTLQVAPTAALNANDVGVQVYNVTVSDGTNPVVIVAEITVNAAIAFTSAASLPDATQNTTYAGFTVTTTGGTGAVTFSITVGALPAGLTLAAGGAVSGGTTVAPANFTFTITATDSLGATTTQAADIDVVAPAGGIPTITTTSPLPAGTVSAVYTTVTFAATGGAGAPYTWALAPTSGALPAGMTLGAAGDLTGTPTAAGTFNITVRVTDSASVFADGAFSITINAAGGGGGGGGDDDDDGGCVAGNGSSSWMAMLAVLGLLGLAIRLRRARA